MVSAGQADGKVRIWETATGKLRRTLRGHRGPVRSLAFSPGNRMLASGSEDTTVVVWDLDAPASGKRDRRLIGSTPIKAWQALAGSDGQVAFDAIGLLRNTPEQTLPLLEKKIKPIPMPDPNRLKRLLAALDSDRFTEREQASNELAGLGEAVAPELLAALKQKPSREVSMRLQRLLDRLNSSAPSGESLRALRAVEILEGIGTRRARALLEKLGKGAAGARLPREARAALRRLADRPVKP
jgi:hypothetical protein